MPSLKPKLTMKGRLALLAGLALLGVCVLAALAVGSNQVNQRALTRLYDQDIEALVGLQQLENGLLEVRFRAAGVLLDQLPIPGSLNHLHEVRKANAELWAQFEPRGAQLYVDGDGADAFKQLAQGWGLVETTMAKLEKGYATKDKNLLGAVLEEDWPAMHKGMVKPLQALIPITQQSAAQRYHAAVNGSRMLLIIGVVTAAVCLLLLGVVAWLTARSMLLPLRQVELSMRRMAEGDLASAMPAARHDEVGAMIAALADMRERLRALVAELKHSSDSIATASVQIAAGSQDLSGRTELAASNLQQTAGSMEELTGTVRQSADSARHANDLAATAASVAQRGGNVVSQVVATMDDIHASSRQIADITGTIDGIAFQTNILALNAAVEAARAGEQGRGFAVVAAEVRSLAQRSAEAAKQIKTLIADSVDRVASGSKLVADAGATMNEIVVSVKQVSDIIGEISIAAGEQSQGIGQVNGAVAQLDQMTQQNAALVEQSAAAAETLKSQAGRLAQAVGTFKV
ncbi:MAG TPA: methyl-accepting chemotaxis protein [Burkholderiaceae bacterium]|nr:methyl-accepting chemotaxis protein [Burkholderiaceae bacterium]